jgi:hypothetical protein
LQGGEGREREKKRKEESRQLVAARETKSS